MKTLKHLAFCFTFFTGLCSYGQESPADSLSPVRKLFTTNVYKHGIKLSKGQFAFELKESSKWTRKNKIANIILPAGPIISAGGIYLAYDAIKGVPMVAYIDGETYPYVVRSLPKLLGGLALFVTGLSLVESANETKTNATNWHNEHLKEQLIKKETSFHLQFGVSQTGGLGLVANF